MKINKIRHLDFTLLPVIESQDIFTRLEEDVNSKLNVNSPLKEIYERSESSLMFFFGTSEEKEQWMNSAFIRAGLNEFYSIEDAAKRDFKKHLGNLKPSLIRDSFNPLVHVMYLLRHVNVHAKVTITRVHNVSIISRLGGSEHEYEYGAIILESSTFSELLECQEAKKYYNMADLEKAANWLDDAQYVFGVSEVLRRGLSAYCRELVHSAKIMKDQ